MLGWDVWDRAWSAPLKNLTKAQVDACFQLSAFCMSLCAIEARVGAIYSFAVERHGRDSMPLCRTRHGDKIA
jgi:hypothetical protein